MKSSQSVHCLKFDGIGWQSLWYSNFAMFWIILYLLKICHAMASLNCVPGGMQLKLLKKHTRIQKLKFQSRFYADLGQKYIFVLNIMHAKRTPSIADCSGLFPIWENLLLLFHTLQLSPSGNQFVDLFCWGIPGYFGRSCPWSHKAWVYRLCTTQSFMSWYLVS